MFFSNHYLSAISALLCKSRTCFFLSSSDINSILMGIKNSSIRWANLITRWISLSRKTYTYGSISVKFIIVRRFEAPLIAKRVALILAFVPLICLYLSSLGCIRMFCSSFNKISKPSNRVLDEVDALMTASWALNESRLLYSAVYIFNYNL